MAQANTTADRALEILLMFDDEQPVVSAGEVATRFGMGRSTAYRYLSSLRAQGLLMEAVDGGFRLGPRIFTLARIARRGFSILQISEPHLQRLLAQTRETVLLTQRNGDELIVIECLESPGPLRISYERGRVLPTPASAAAKVFMAFGPEADSTRILKRRKPIQYTSQTITDPARIAETLADVRTRGYAVNVNEVDEGVAAVAVPIFASSGQVTHSLSIVAPTSRTDVVRLRDLAAMAKSSADQINSEIAATF